MVKAVKRRLQHRNPKVQFLALTVSFFLKQSRASNLFYLQVFQLVNCVLNLLL